VGDKKMPEHSYATGNTDFQRLLAIGFTATEAEKLLYMREHVDEQIEYREIMEESRRLNFIRWLIDHDRMSH
jgi:hypothetical protein